MEVCQPSPSQPPESSFFPSCSLESPLSSPSGPHLPNSVSLSQSPTENQVISKKISEKGVVDSLKYVDIPVRDEEENQCALSNQLTESFTHRKSNVSSHKEDSNLLLVREVLCSLDIKVYFRRKNSGSIGVWVQGISEGWLKISLELNEKKKSLLNDLANFDAIEQLYASPTGESWGVEGLDWSSISEESALRLDSPFTEEEISKTIFQLDRDKAPGPNDFTIAVFQDYFRPISLITSLYKIIAKVLSGRLRGVLHETIHYTQGTFVQGRQILDAILIANEIVDERRQSGEEGVVFKIDFEKAYDHMNAKGWVKASRGLRQGDPLSPLKVNIDKSSIYDINLDQVHLSRLAEMLDCKASGWPILYLGLPLGGNLKVCGFWDPVIERISRNEERIRFWEDLWWGDQPLGTQYPRLFRVVVDKNIPISSVLGPTRPFSWNLNFCRNLSDSEIEDLEGLMRSLDELHLSPSVPDARFWPLSSSRLFLVKSFFLALSQFSESSQDFPSKFVWNSQVPFKVKSFI
ncbi:Transposon TX1 uncharacterized 149 kDa protein [Vitis vinifera]|uniref:Transposon TX1 uncharacterized 149 kDa protein n=1 Tax=Vitis vinifera TaxID=29760 RepID=A0A438DI41_VITVI|nr:Transposon TX1 uncharacterized 149 kDa protein [Vitis vinifera]